MMQAVETHTVFEDDRIKVTLTIERLHSGELPAPTPVPDFKIVSQVSRARWADREALIFPLWASIKHNGIRGEITPAGARTRWMKKIPNRHIRTCLATLPQGLEGEIVAFKHGQASFRAAQRAVMCEDGEPGFHFFVFDDFLCPGSFADRYERLKSLKLPPWAEVVEQMTCRCLEDLDRLYEAAIVAGREGLVLRDPDADYFFGYAPEGEQAFLKMKPVADAEAVVTGIVPSKDDPGRCRALIVRSDAFPGVEFKLSSGLTAADRCAPPKIGETVTFSYQRGEGIKPRHTAFLGVRKDIPV